MNRLAAFLRSLRPNCAPYPSPRTVPSDDPVWVRARALWCEPGCHAKSGPWRYTAAEIVALLDDPRVTEWALYARAKRDGWPRRRIGSGGLRLPMRERPLRRCPNCYGQTREPVCPHIPPGRTRPCGTQLVELHDEEDAIPYIGPPLTDDDAEGAA